MTCPQIFLLFCKFSVQFKGCKVGTEQNDDYDRNAKFDVLQILHKLCTENELKLPVTGKRLNPNCL